MGNEKHGPVTRDRAVAQEIISRWKGLTSAMSYLLPVRCHSWLSLHPVKTYGDVKISTRRLAEEIAERLRADVSCKGGVRRSRWAVESHRGDTPLSDMGEMGSAKMGIRRMSVFSHTRASYGMESGGSGAALRLLSERRSATCVGPFSFRTRGDNLEGWDSPALLYLKKAPAPPASLPTTVYGLELGSAGRELEEQTVGWSCRPPHRPCATVTLRPRRTAFAHTFPTLCRSSTMARNPVSAPATTPLLRPTSARPQTAASSRPEGHSIVALLEGRGISREIGMAALNPETGRVIMVQVYISFRQRNTHSSDP